MHVHLTGWGHPNYHAVSDVMSMHRHMKSDMWMLAQVRSQVHDVCDANWCSVCVYLRRRPITCGLVKSQSRCVEYEQAEHELGLSECAEPIVATC